MIQAELRRIHSPDVPNLDSFVPALPDHFEVLVQAMIGPRGSPGEESFDFVVCTPSWLAERAAESGYLLGRHYLIVNHFDVEAVRGALLDLCRQATGSDWGIVANYLARFGKWEFEDYQEGSAAWL